MNITGYMAVVNYLLSEGSKMKKIGSKGMDLLKGMHVFFGCMWIGTAITICVKLYFITATDSGELFGIMSTLDFIDINILVPSAVGLSITSFIYSAWTHWGCLKHRWITVKWIICIAGIVFGTYPLRPFLNSLAIISKEKGLAALSDPVFIYHKNILMMLGTFQCILLIAAIFITVIKPWKRKQHERKIYSNANRIQRHSYSFKTTIRANNP
jgi:hypothetical protein